MKKLWAGLLLTSAIDLAFASIAFAQQAATDQSTLEEVMVTATKTGAQAAQKTPIAVSAFTEDQIQSEHIGSVKDLVDLTPDLQVTQNTANAEIYVRGIGSSNVNAGSDPDVTVQIDGVYVGRPSGQFADLADVGQIEVLRGPQGTLYGRNAAGGTINVTSREPSDTFHAMADVSTGSYNLFQTRDYITGPITDNLQDMLAVSYLYHDPYIKNLAPGGKGLDNANHGSLKDQLRFEPTSKIDATTRVDWSSGYEDFESFDHVLMKTSSPATLANSLIGNYNEVAVKSPQWENFYNGGISEEINYHVTDYLDIKSITAWRENYYKLEGTADGTELNLAFINSSEKQSQLSEEITAQLTLDQLRAVMGIYYLEEGVHGAIAADATLSPVPIHGTDPYVYDRSKAVYGQATYSVTNDLHITGGARFTEETKTVQMDAFADTAHDTLIPGSIFDPAASSQYYAFTPKGGIDYQLLDNAMAYFSVTKGFKSGGFNNAATTVSTLEFGPEKILSYEVGAKTDWFDKRLRVNLTGFYYDYNGLQVQSLLSPGVATILNANTATVKGAELEMKVKPVSGLTLTSNASLLRANYGTFTNDAVPTGILPLLLHSPLYNAGTGFYNATGNTMVNAPRYSGQDAAEYDYDLPDGQVFAKAEYAWQTRTYYDASNISVLSQPFYGVVNLAVGYTPPSGAWTFQVMAKNITDKEYLIGAAANGNVLGHAGDPRTIFCTISRSW